MSLAKHAERELKLAGLFDKDSDYEGMLGKAVLTLVKAFAKQGHSGFSAGRTLAIFVKVARFENLTPITSKPEEWMKVEGGIEKMWQCKRNPALFSKDGGKTWYDVNKPNKGEVK